MFSEYFWNIFKICFGICFKSTWIFRYSRDCGSYNDFLDRGLLLTRKLLNQATHLGLHLSTHAEKETRYIQYGPLLLISYQLRDIYSIFRCCWNGILWGLCHTVFSRDPLTSYVTSSGNISFTFKISLLHLGLHLSTHAEKETRYIQYGPLLLFQ
jgi:hypothetical protein